MRRSHFVFAVIVALMGCWGLTFALTAQEFHDKGEAAHKVKDYAKAVEYYTEALKIEPKRPATLYARGVNYYKLKKYSAAKADFESVLNIPNIAPHAFNYIGLIHSKANEHTEALAAFKKASDLRPRNLTYCLNKARSAAASGDRISAIRYYKQAMAIDPKNQEADNYIAARRAAIEKYEEGQRRKQAQEELQRQREARTERDVERGLGLCRSEEDLQRVRDILQSKLQPGEIGLLVWCVSADDRGSIVYAAGHQREVKPGDSKELRDAINEYFAGIRSFHQARAKIEGGCVRPPVEETFRP